MPLIWEIFIWVYIIGMAIILILAGLAKIVDE
jgi:hypothetical protein